MSIPIRCAARMIVSPFSKGISRPSSLKVGMFELAFGTFYWAARGPSVVTLSANHVERSERRHDVRDHLPGDELAKPLRDRKTRGPDAHAVRRAAAVRDEIETELAVAAFGISVGLAGGHFDAFHDDLE